MEPLKIRVATVLRTLMNFGVEGKPINQVELKELIRKASKGDKKRMVSQTTISRFLHGKVDNPMDRSLINLISPWKDLRITHIRGEEPLPDRYKISPVAPQQKHLIESDQAIMIIQSIAELIIASGPDRIRAALSMFCHDSKNKLKVEGGKYETFRVKGKLEPSRADHKNRRGKKQ